MSSLIVTISHLERLGSKAALPSEIPVGMSLRYEEQASWELYRDFYFGVGYSNFWWERRLWTQDQWQDLQKKSQIELWCLYEGDSHAGYFELNFGGLPTTAELSFFGLYSDFIGRGLGRMLLNQALHRLLEKSPARILLNTCDLDNSAALPLYESCGFSCYRVEERVIEDPRHAGIFPSDMPLPSDYTGAIN